MTTARELARRVLDRVDQKGAWATPALDGELSRSGLDERDRRLVAELVYGVLRHRARLDHALAAHANLARTPPRVRTAMRVAAYQVLMLDRIPPYAAVDDAVAAARAVGGGKVAGFANAVLRKLVTSGEPALPSDPRERVAIAASLPPWIVDELASSGGDVATVAAALAEPPPLIARVRRGRISRDQLIARLADEGTTATPIEGPAAAVQALALANCDPARSPSFADGLWTVQDVGAQLVGHVAAPRPGMRILDACAGVGGKATHLAELMIGGELERGPGATDAIRPPLDAADQSPTKLALLEQTAARLGLAGIQPIRCDLTDPAAPLADHYDLIVLDAPCSGLGVLRRHPDAKWRVTAADVPRLAAIQRQLLTTLAGRVAPGGALIYSVCTFTHAEGPDQIATFAASHGFTIVEQHRTWPPAADGFFIARLVRT